MAERAQSDSDSIRVWQLFNQSRFLLYRLIRKWETPTQQIAFCGRLPSRAEIPRFPCSPQSLKLRPQSQKLFTFVAHLLRCVSTGLRPVDSYLLALVWRLSQICTQVEVNSHQSDVAGENPKGKGQMLRHRHKKVEGGSQRSLWFHLTKC